MASPSLLRRAARPNLDICTRCAFRTSKRLNSNDSSYIGRILGETTEPEIAKSHWQQRAHNVKAGIEPSMLTILSARGLVHTVTGAYKDVDSILTDKQVGVYVGIDPTASSLHIGHMLPLMSLFWMYLHGYKTVSLVGGATARIGDPTDRLTTRAVMEDNVRSQNVSDMIFQLRTLWDRVDAYANKYGYEREKSGKRIVLNNNSWMEKLLMMDFLQIIGPGMRMGPMMARDTVKNKMSRGDGMSFAEFSYPLLQAWDWWDMYHTKGVQMQIGGSDQYGNITAGIDGVKYIAASHPDAKIRQKVESAGQPIGFTVPLLATPSGVKLGKSVGNAIWLNPEMTSSFDLYKFFLGLSDGVIESYLRRLTFMPLEQIEDIVAEHEIDPSKRVAQHALARDFVELVHGEEQARSAESAHKTLYVRNSEQDFLRPDASMKLPRSVFDVSNIGRVLLACGLAKSTTEGHDLARQSAFYVGDLTEGRLNFSPIQKWDGWDSAEKNLIDGNLLIVRRGKTEVRFIEVVTDEEYQAEQDAANSTEVASPDIRRVRSRSIDIHSFVPLKERDTRTFTIRSKAASPPSPSGKGLPRTDRKMFHSAPSHTTASGSKISSSPPVEQDVAQALESEIFSSAPVEQDSGQVSESIHSSTLSTTTNKKEDILTALRTALFGHEQTEEQLLRTRNRVIRWFGRRLREASELERHSAPSPLTDNGGKGGEAPPMTETLTDDGLRTMLFGPGLTVKNLQTSRNRLHRLFARKLKEVSGIKSSPNILPDEPPSYSSLQSLTDTELRNALFGSQETKKQLEKTRAILKRMFQFSLKHTKLEGERTSEGPIFRKPERLPTDLQSLTDVQLREALFGPKQTAMEIKNTSTRFNNFLKRRIISNDGEPRRHPATGQILGKRQIQKSKQKETPEEELKRLRRQLKELKGSMKHTKLPIVKNWKPSGDDIIIRKYYRRRDKKGSERAGGTPPTGQGE